MNLMRASVARRSFDAFLNGDDVLRAIIVIVLLAIILSFVGWLSFSSPDGDPTIRVNADKVKQDTSAIIDKGREVINNAGDNIEQSEPVAQ